MRKAICFACLLFLLFSSCLEKRKAAERAVELLVDRVFSMSGENMEDDRPNLKLSAGGFYYGIIFEDGKPVAEVAGYENKDMKNVVVPESIEGMPVVSADFSDGYDLVTVVLPKTIRRFTFANCSSLTMAEIPDSVESLGIFAFEDCTSLIEMEMPKSLKHIGDFANCQSLASIKVPQSVAAIGYKAFEDCFSLKKLRMPRKLKSDYESNPEYFDLGVSDNVVEWY